MSKLLKTLALTLSLTSIGALAPMVANAAWYQNENEWYYTNNSGNNVTGWQQIDGNWYYMWSDGSMAKNTWLESNSKWYYLGNSGAMVYNTVIDGYTIGNEGYWIVTSNGELKYEDVKPTHAYFRSDLSQGSRYVQMSDSISSSNINTNEESQKLLNTIAGNLSQEKLDLSEAKSNCIGKTIEGKYVIENITFLSRTYKNTDCIGIGNQADVVKQSDIMDYKPSSSYVYDKYLIFNSSQNNSSQWEVKRIVIEFKEV
ncbi:hypothetical protein [Clostridium butyricum]|uniref:hypothetical protein n=1 Tax=Clostridium butyricum TaxID=1492 RepID=UPI00374E47D7